MNPPPPPFGSEVRVPFAPHARYPDPAVEVLDDSFLPLRLYSASVEQLATGLRWAEGPQWMGDARCLLLSDIPNNRILKWDETTGLCSEFRRPSGMANGLARDARGRLLTCEHLTRRVTRTEHDGRITVLADQLNGRRLNSPNDIVCQRNGTIWFTDPEFGLHGHWEGQPAASELPQAVYRLRYDDASGQADLQPVVTDLAAPNGLAFTADERTLYVVESRAKPYRLIWAYDVNDAGELSRKRLAVDAEGAGALDGMAVDVAGNLWCGFGSDGRAGAPSQGLDGVRVFNPQGRAIAHIHLPERCANVCFGGAQRNRLFMAASHSLYALFVNTQGAAPL